MEPVICFLTVDKTCVDIFCILLKFLEDLLESENLVYMCHSQDETALGILELWFNYFAASFFKALGIYFFKCFRCTSTAPWSRCHCECETTIFTSFNILFQVVVHLWVFT